jgi:hypothetical protein
VPGWSIALARGHDRFDRVGRERFVACRMIRAKVALLAKTPAQDAAARTASAVNSSKRPRKKACSQVLVAQEGIGKGDGGIIDPCDWPMAAPCGMPQPKMSMAPARGHAKMGGGFRTLTLWCLLAWPPPATN